MALHSEVMGIDTNSRSQFGKAIALGAIQDSMASGELSLPSRYIFYP